MLSAGRAQPPDGLSLIDSAGESFRMGDSQPGALSVNLPVRTVQFTYDFYLGQTEVTYAQWKQVREWALTHGYPDLPVGQIGADATTTKGRPDNPANGQQPVTCIDWYDVVKCCNAQSELSGRQPCYFTDEAMVSVVRSGRPAIVYCNWTVDGYRLPTSAEWEYAARGGNDDGRRFPWGNDPIGPDRANYYSYIFPYETGGAIGLNPLYNGTAPVGSFPETGFHLRDMAGNVAEWVWDLFLSGYYDRPDPDPDPRGPECTHHIDPMGTPACVTRGGSYMGDASLAGCGDASQAPPRDNSDPRFGRPYRVGFRFAVTAPGVVEVTQNPASLSAASGGTVSTAFATTAAATSVQWYCNGRPVVGATATILNLETVGPAMAGLYDAALSAGTAGALTRPAVVGIRPAPGRSTAGMVTTRAAWRDIRDVRSGNTYDQYLLTGPAGTFSADAGQIARLSFLDPNGSIVQVEMSGAGATTVVLDDASGPMAPALYNQAGIQYMQGKATIVLADADETTHLSVYSVGTATNPGVTRGDVAYVGWADVGSVGIVSANGGLGGIHQGNVFFNNSRGFAGLYAPTVDSVAGPPVVIHDIAASADAIPYLLFGDLAQVRVKIAGGCLEQPCGDPITVAGLQQVLLGAGQDSCGRAAAPQSAKGCLTDLAGNDVTNGLVGGP